MNLLMAGMLPTMRFLMPRVVGGEEPLAGGFWFVVSMALIVGFVLAYPVNWWLVARGLKHGMITTAAPEVERRSDSATGMKHLRHEHNGRHDGKHAMSDGASKISKAGITLLSIACLAISVWLTQRLVA